MTRSYRIAALALAVLLLLPVGVQAKSRGQTIYVPCYSHIYQGPRSRPLNLSVMLSVRNVDMVHSLTLTAVEYYDTNGKMVRSELPSPISLAPLMTREFMVQTQDTSGGSGANYIVKWLAETPVNAPLVEAVMIGTQSGLGISFVRQGRVLEE
ncbi:MAG: DUF3124 domain-containing protein [Desulfovibrionaceae bacterium]